ncbi:MAG: hypothetical protein K2X86_02810 [Cytophagaceae bacterium]|nr:hypothetical protein [Cytophagaceae bacterium]
MTRSLSGMAMLMIALYGCDGPYDNCPEVRFSEEFKNYTMFNPGSYWIYEDSSGSFTDSLILVIQSLPFYSRCDYNSIPQEVLLQEFYSSFFADSGFVKGYGDPNWEEYSQSKNNNSLGYYINKVNVGQTGGFQSEMKYEQYLDSLNIRGVWYKKIKIISAARSPNVKFYWAKNVGIIKKSITKSLGSDTIYHFELIRYKLK